MHRHFGNAGQILALDQHMAGIAAQARALALRAGLAAEVLGQFFAHHGGFGFPVASLHIGQDAFKRIAANHGIAAVIDIVEVNDFIAAAMENYLAVLFRQLLEGLVDGKAVVLSQGGEHGEIVDIAPIPASNRPFRQGQAIVGDDAGFIEILFQTQAVAAGAGAGRIIKGKQSWFQFGDAVTAHGAGKQGGEHQVFTAFVFHIAHHCQAVGQLQGSFKAFRQALFQTRLDLEAVYHRVDAVFLVLFQIGRVIDLADQAVHPGADKAAAAQFIEHMQVFALALADNGGQHHHPAAFRQGHDLVHHLADGLGFQFDVMIRAVGIADPGEQQAQVVVNLGNGAHGGAGIMGGGFLFNGNSR